MLAVILVLGAAGIAGCDKSDPGAGTATGGRLQVVAAENFWGSIAAQLGGDRTRVSSIIVNPSTDPHSYEPSARDARTMAGAKLAIVNGIGYDNWAPKLLAASPLTGRTVLNVGQLLGLQEGDNPHQWYSPASVQKVIAQIVADYDGLDPAGAAYYAQRERTFETVGLARYDQLRKEIRSRYAGTPVGYSESIFRPLGEDLGLRLLTPYSFAKAVAEGTDVTRGRQAGCRSPGGRSADKGVGVQQPERDARRAARERARASAGIPIATVTETLDPASDTFEQWQVAELEGLLRALHEATGR